MSDIKLKLDVKVEKTVTVEIRKNTGPFVDRDYQWDWYVDENNESSIRFKTVEEAVEAAKVALS